MEDSGAQRIKTKFKMLRQRLKTGGLKLKRNSKLIHLLV
jgi:hypothetical protein